METGRYKEVIVWEWLDDMSVWLPYPSHVSNYIEQEYKSSSNTATSAVIPLARIDYAYRTYQIDTVRSVQENTYTGCCRPVRRELYKSPSPLAEGIFWEWNAMPNVWKPYNSKDAEQLESAYSKQAVSLMICVAEHQYHIDLNNMTQTNQATGFMRNIKRHLLTMPYLVNNTPASTTYQNQNVIARQCMSPTSNTTSGTPNPAAATFWHRLLHYGLSFYNSFFMHKKNDSERLSDTSNHLVDSFTTKVAKPEDDDCVICCEKLSSPSGYDSHDSIVLQLLRCKHQYHRACLLQMYKAGNENGGFQCPVCKCIYGLKVGNCPPGTIKVVTLPTSLPGYPNCGTIAITYNIRGGVQGSDHPNPGKPFTARGFPRTGYLPDNTQGRKVSRLLQEAWKRRLTFTVGTSSTTGEQDTVIWNEIHHKTSMENYTGHGYPDPNYLDNVLKELEQQGVVDS